MTAMSQYRLIPSLGSASARRPLRAAATQRVVQRRRWQRVQRAHQLARRRRRHITGAFRRVGPRVHHRHDARVATTRGAELQRNDALLQVPMRLVEPLRRWAVPEAAAVALVLAHRSQVPGARSRTNSLVRPLEHRRLDLPLPLVTKTAAAVALAQLRCLGATAIAGGGRARSVSRLRATARTSRSTPCGCW